MLDKRINVIWSYRVVGTLHRKDIGISHKRMHGSANLPCQSHTRLHCGG